MILVGQFCCRGAISTFNMVIMRTAMLSIDSSMEESAQLDGASQFTILFKIMVPLTKATIAVLVLYYGVAHWNSWFNAMVYLQDTSKYPLQLWLRQILIMNEMSATTDGNDSPMLGESIRYANIVVATLPILCLYPFLQKYFVKGMMVGAVKVDLTITMEKGKPCACLFHSKKGEDWHVSGNEEKKTDPHTGRM